jgi:hypothetical protein
VCNCIVKIAALSTVGVKLYLAVFSPFIAGHNVYVTVVNFPNKSVACMAH